MKRFTIRKRDSKRRWVKRWKLGRMIPWLVVEEYELVERLVPSEFLINVDAIRRDSRICEVHRSGVGPERARPQVRRFDSFGRSTSHCCGN